MPKQLKGKKVKIAIIVNNHIQSKNFLNRKNEKKRKFILNLRRIFSFFLFIYLSMDVFEEMSVKVTRLEGQDVK